MTTKQVTAPQEACAGWTPGHEKKTGARLRMHPSMNNFPAMMMLVLSLYKNRPYSVCPTTHSVDRVRDGMRPCCEPMSNRDYRERDGGARLEEVWHVSIEGFVEWESGMSSMRPSSG